MRIPKSLYRPTRHAYQALLNRPYARERRERERLLAQFVRPGSLVFDVGANKGDYTDALLDLRARVIAIEPNPTLAQDIRQRYGVVVEEVALGANSGTLELHLGVNPGHSTLSDRWLMHAPTQDRWNGVVPVTVETLDELVSRHGLPDFVKIDVEGFEAEVLGGCSTLPQALAFEYQCADLAIAERCIAMLVGYEFNTVRFTQTTFAGDWLDADFVLERIDAERTEDSTAYGDVYARRVVGQTTR